MNTPFPKTIALALLAAAFAAPIRGQCAAATPDAPANAAAAWLAEVDAAEYDASWQHMATYARGLVTQADWRRTIRGARGPLGALVSRTVSSRTPSTKLPGAPDGQYVTFTYATELAHKKEATETVVMMRDADDAWRVAGYFIR